ncbi:MAG: L-threonylcarbamoyladenylate synthase, partial [Peptococcaceae bacterium]|nr:L-threonylcarbamoyladenylate synthase [Peptococcaceae bacterium]
MLLNIDREEDLRMAVDALRAGKLVAFPTETVYGLGADGFNEEACRAVYAAKGRPSDNPLILHIADMSALRDIAEDIPEAAVDLAEAFWPGPLTLVLKKRRNVSSVVSGGLDTVAVRMPDNDLARRLIRALGHPLAGPSANLSGHPSPTLAAHVEHDFGDHIA